MQNRGQEMHVDTEDCINKDAHSAAKQDGNGQQHQTNELINYFYSSNNTYADKSKSAAMTQRIHEMYGEVFKGIGCFKGTFSLQLKPNSKPYQVPPRCTETFQGGASVSTRIVHHNATGSR